MSELRLHLLSTRDSRVPNLDIDGKPFPGWFSEATAGRLTLRPVAHPPFPHDGPCDSATLHRILRWGLGQPSGRPVHDIGVVFCDRWVRPNVRLRGLMFDYRGSDARLGRFSDEGVPREGCAVFMGRHAGDDRRAAMTAAHELGHVFNLQHDGSTRSFMATPVPRAGFKSADRDRLGLAADGNWFHAPGGENFQFVPTLEESGAARRGSSAVELRARVARRTYLPAEPVALQLRLVPRGRRARTADRLDPGYGNLRIWIGTPLGERILHQPFVRYCHFDDTPLEITKRKPLINNPRIHFGKRGFHFDQAGEYSVRAEFDVTPATTVVSNVCTFRVRRSENAFEERMLDVISRPDVARFLTDKGGVLSSSDARALKELAATREHESPALDYVRYALAREYEARGRAAEARRTLVGVAPADSVLRKGVQRLQNRLRGASSGPKRGRRATA